MPKNPAVPSSHSRTNGKAQTNLHVGTPSIKREKREGDSQFSGIWLFRSFANNSTAAIGKRKMKQSNEMIRCVRVDDVDHHWTIPALTETGAAHIHFCNIQDAISFMREHVQDPDFENSNVLFTADPCAKATGIHHENPNI
ncbi:MAG: hypothetical protein Q9157_003548 [Trypethelium eluteriae]